MKTYKYPSPTEWQSLLKRPVKSIEAIEKDVLPVLEAVKANGDNALRDFTEKFDKVKLNSFKVSETEIEQSASLVSPELKQAIAQAYDNIYKFHISQKQAVEEIETMQGVKCWRRSVPISHVGFYIPGGTAPLFSTVLMLAIPAKIAGCKNIVLCTPPDLSGKINPAILYTAHYCGVTQIYKVGGSQAIAALAYGTETVPQVHKIFGPGNQYVMAAKQLVNKSGVAIDMPAGPSEVAVIADNNANPSFVAADLLSQAEHGPDSQVVLISNDEKLIEKVIKETENQLKLLPRSETASLALKNSKAILVHTLDEAMEISNTYAPEHLILATENAHELAEKVVNAGSVFLGNFTPEAAGDYASGTNHTLPTNGYATAYSGVSLDSFFKKITFQHISEKGIKNVGPIVEIMAENEQLQAHKYAVTVRLESLK